MVAGPQGMLKGIRDDPLRRKFPQVDVAEDVLVGPLRTETPWGVPLPAACSIPPVIPVGALGSGEGTGVCLSLQFTYGSELIMIRSLGCILCRQGGGSELTMFRCSGRLPHLSHSFHLCNVADETPA